MSVGQKVKHEVRAVALTTAYFAAWFGVLLCLKALILAEYQIKFLHFSLAIVGALIVAKVVLILDRIPLGGWIDRAPGWVEVLVRTALYSAGVSVVLLIEKAFEARHEYGGFARALGGVLRHADIQQVWAAAIGISGALLVFNAFALLRRHVGDGELVRMVMSPASRSNNEQREQVERFDPQQD